MGGCSEARCSSAPSSHKEDLGHQTSPRAAAPQRCLLPAGSLPQGEQLGQGCPSSGQCLEELEQPRLFLCRCKKKVPASKRFTIHRASNVLTLSLKRFADFGRRKITKVGAQQRELGLSPGPRACCPAQGGRWPCAHPQPCSPSPAVRRGGSLAHPGTFLTVTSAWGERMPSCSGTKAVCSVHRTWGTLSSWTSARTCLRRMGILSCTGSMLYWCTLGSAATQGTTTAT